ncbi:hypothetical protein M3Y98_00740800 [Aphelenchoides besseyi]|nr:hypothetical protein M3Y98_00740800 [Aphelenchoides besseyi]
MRITGHIPNKLPGRIRCECQARIHSLIRNCTSCGRIVCEQEGSGPLSTMTRKKGAELQRRLLREAGYGSDIARRKNEDEAQNYRDMLLKADRESVARNKVFDLDSDYYNIETSHYLTDEERKAIQKRKDDLKHQRQNRARQPMVMELDFAKGTVTDTSKQQQIETAEDEVIQSILARASRRQQEQSSSGYTLRDKKLPTSSNFMARYNIDSSRSEVPPADAFDFSHSVADRDHLYAEVERKCYCLSVVQPLASRIVNGRKNYLPVEEEVQVQGPIFVASTKNEGTNTAQLPEFSIIGKVILFNCITMSEFKEEYPEYNETGNQPFVLLFKDAYPFETPLPYISNTTFGRLPKPMRELFALFFLSHLIKMATVELRRDPAVPTVHADTEENQIKAILAKAAVGVVTYPLTFAKTLFQLGFEPYPLSTGRVYIAFGREAYFLPNTFSYVRNVYEEHGLKALYRGVEAGFTGTLVGGFASYYFERYLDVHYPEVGGKPEFVNKDEEDLSHYESFRNQLRIAIRRSLSVSVGVTLTQPFFVLMVREIAQHIGGESKYQNVVLGILRVGAEEGPAGLFSGLIPNLVANYIRVFGIASLTFGINRALLHFQKEAKDDDQKKAMKDMRKYTPYVVPFVVNAWAYPFEVVTTLLAVTGSHLAVSMLPYAPLFNHWDEAYGYLKPHGLIRGNRSFLREHKGAISVGTDHQLYASNKFFV